MRLQAIETVRRNEEDVEQAGGKQTCEVGCVGKGRGCAVRR